MGWDPDREKNKVLDGLAYFGYYAAMAQLVIVLILTIVFIVVLAVYGDSGTNTTEASPVVFGVVVVLILLLFGLPGILAHYSYGFSVFWGGISAIGLASSAFMPSTVSGGVQKVQQNFAVCR